MVVKVKTEKEYVYRYMQAIQAYYRLSPREVDVASAMVYRFRVLETARSKFSSKQKRDDYDPMVELKKPTTLKLVCEELKMDFDVFRGYIKRLKDRTFFVDGTINSDFLPGKTKSSVEIWM